MGSISKSSSRGLSLQQAMITTHPTDESFQKFKFAVKRHYRTLNIQKGRNKQDSHEWQSFLNKVTSNDPALLVYEDCWPVEVFFNSLVKRHVCVARNTNQTLRLPVIPRPPGIRMYRLTAELQDAMKATHPTPRSFEVFKSVVRDHMANLDRKYRQEQPDDLWQGFLQAVLSSEPSLTGRYEDCWPIEYYFNFVVKNRIKKQKEKKPFGADSSQASSKASRTSTSSSSSSTITRTNIIQPSVSPEPELCELEEETVNYPTLISSCFLCRPPTSVDSSLNKKFAVLFANDSEILQTLASHGIRLDQHLDILLRLDDSLLERLVVSIPSKELGSSAKYRLLVLLEQARANRAAAGDLRAFNDTLVIAQLPCQVHQTVDISMVSSGIRKSLQIHGGGELVPAFAVMGLFTEGDFSFFCKLNEYSRASLIKTKKVQLSHFQEFMLNLAFGSSGESLFGNK